MKYLLVIEQKLYRGIGSNYTEGTNEGFLWVSPDRELAERYSSGEIEEYDYPIEDMKILEFTYKGNPKVQASNVFGGFIYPIINTEYKAGNIDDLDYVLEQAKYIKEIMGEEMEYVHTKINKPNVSELLSLFLQLLGYDGISLMEDGIKTYGIIKS